MLIDPPTVAVTKIMGNKINNIIVKDTTTAKNCIEFLKHKYAGEKHSVIETFLPLDYLPIRSSDHTRK